MTARQLDRRRFSITYIVKQNMIDSILFISGLSFSKGNGSSGCSVDDLGCALLILAMGVGTLFILTFFEALWVTLRGQAFKSKKNSDH